MKKYYMFNKPSNCVTARTDALHKTVMDYFPDEIKENFHPIGRLDIDTVGLLLITNDGKLTFRLAQPEFHVEKKYFFYALGFLDDEKILALNSGIFLKGSNILTAPAKIEVLDNLKVQDIADLLDVDGKSDYLKNPNGKVVSGYITITEGRNHQVKRMLKKVNCHVVYLKRVSMGKLELDNSLNEGDYRELTADELEILLN